jgi:hypothetical protein
MRFFFPRPSLLLRPCKPQQRQGAVWVSEWQQFCAFLASHGGGRQRAKSASEWHGISEWREVDEGHELSGMRSMSGIRSVRGTKSVSGRRLVSGMSSVSGKRR